jgi:hypothetical protein
VGSAQNRTLFNDDLNQHASRSCLFTWLKKFACKKTYSKTSRNQKAREMSDSSPFVQKEGCMCGVRQHHRHRTVLSRLGIASASKGLPVSVSSERSENWYGDLQQSKKRFKCVFYLDFFLLISAVKENILYECQNPHTSSFRHTWADKTYKWTQGLVRNGTCHSYFELQTFL